jgi:secreted Zn-dependent insulinase-like peptidase
MFCKHFVVLINLFFIDLIWIFQSWMEKAPDENLSLPKPNVFIATDLSLKNAQEKVNTQLYIQSIFLLN